ncbi:MAG: DUF368 domain-containing protein [Lachnospiraceae bacterium]|nr:DUF368 domain-containing protein [Lachnospiraceae bacterium]
MKNDNIKALYKGAIIGGTMLVPGVSGGSMAMILGIYNKLISSVSSFFKDVKKNLIFLLLFVVGAGIGMLIFAKPLLNLIENQTLPMMYFFIGAVAGGVPMICRSAKVKEMSWKDIVYIVIGLATVLLFAFIPEDIFSGSSTSEKTNLVIQVLAGIIAAIALVLPGISVSYMLLLMGLYDKTVKAISELDIAYLLPMAIGLLIGIMLITKLLENAMERHPRPTYLTILGFVIGSIVQVFPGLPQDYQWVICGVLAIAGYFIINTISAEE